MLVGRQLVATFGGGRNGQVQLFEHMLLFLVQSVDFRP